MRIYDAVPLVTETWDWDIAEIMERASSDLLGGMREWWCDDCDQQTCRHRPDLVQAWDDLLEDRRADAHYEAVVISLQDYGFTVPATARVTDGVVALGDGHHRLAAAIDLGWHSIPVVMCGRFSFVSQDSFAWGEDIQWIGGDLVVPPPPEEIIARDGSPVLIGRPFIPEFQH